MSVIREHFGVAAENSQALDSGEVFGRRTVHRAAVQRSPKACTSRGPSRRRIEMSLRRASARRSCVVYNIPAPDASQPTIAPPTMTVVVFTL